MKLLWPLTCWTLNPKPDPYTLLSSGCHGLFNKETDLDKHTRSDADVPQQPGSIQPVTEAGQLPRTASLRKRSSKTLQNSNFLDLLFAADPVSLIGPAPFWGFWACLRGGRAGCVGRSDSGVTPAL